MSPTTGIITRVTGSGHHCVPDDGICLAAVPPCEPVGVAVDRSSDVFVATACGTVREVSGTTGAISTIFSARQSAALGGTGGGFDLSGLAVLDNRTLQVAIATLYDDRLLEINIRSGRVDAGCGHGCPNPSRTTSDGGRRGAGLQGHIWFGGGRGARPARRYVRGRLFQRRHPQDRCPFGSDHHGGRRDPDLGRPTRPLLLKRGAVAPENQLTLVPIRSPIGG